MRATPCLARRDRSHRYKLTPLVLGRMLLRQSYQRSIDDVAGVNARVLVQRVSPPGLTEAVHSQGHCRLAEDRAEERQGMAGAVQDGHQRRAALFWFEQIGLHLGNQPALTLLADQVPGPRPSAVDRFCWAGCESPEKSWKSEHGHAAVENDQVTGADSGWPSALVIEVSSRPL